MRTIGSARVATIRSAVGAVGAEHDGADAAALAGAQDDGTGAVAEDDRGRAIVGVDHARHQVGADHQHGGGPARLDLAGGDRERGDEAAAGGADVEGAGAGGAELGRDLGRGGGSELVVGDGRDQHEVELGGIGAGGEERLGARFRGPVGERLAGSGEAALADAGPRDDPVLVDPQPRGDLGVGDDGGRDGDAQP